MTRPFLSPHHLLKDADLTVEQILGLLTVAAELKEQRNAAKEPQRLVGAKIVLLFEKPSTRTRSAFEVATYEQGGNCTYIDPSSSHMGTSESTEDTAAVLGRFYDGIAFRGFAQDTVDTLALHAGVPVWNALTDRWHPTQALADLLTMQETSTKPLKDVSVCFLGDARDNVANSLLIDAALLGMDIRIACPATLRPDAAILSDAQRFAGLSGARILVTDDVDSAVIGVDYLYTDVWVSMGEPRAAWAERIPLLRPYRIDQQLLDRTKNPQVKFLHCLPSIHDRNSELGRELYANYGLDGAEVSDEVFRSPHSHIFEQAENRLHTIKAVVLGSLNKLHPSNS